MPRILPSKNGLLIQRRPLSNENTNTTPLPLLFSLVHPLKDISPVILKFNANKPLSFLTTSDEFELIGICPERSLCLFYNEEQCLHSIWLLRKASEQEINSVSSVPLSYLHSKCADYSFSSSMSMSMSKQNSSQPYLPFLSSSPKLSPINAKGQKKKNSFNESTNSSMNQLNQAMSTSSPPLPLPFSPLRNVRLAASPGSQMPPMRAFSPTSSPQLIAQNESVLSPQKPTITAQYKQFTNMGTPRFAQSIDNDYCDEVLEPIYPELCLEQIWNETGVGNSPKATKVFLTNDFNNINYLVFVIEKLKQAKLVRFDESNDKQKLIFGTSNYIPAKDAEPIPSLSMILVLDASDCLILYSGLSKISLVNLKEASFGTGGLSSNTSFSTHEQFTRLSLSKKKQNNLSIYSYLTRSPKRFRDSIRNSVYLVTEDNKNFLLSFPPIYCSSIVSMCLNGLKNVLPRDISMQMFINWYKLRTTSLNEVHTVQNELALFKCCILKLCGYDIESLPLNFHLKLTSSTNELLGEVRSPRKSAKKSSTSSINQTKEDWEFICNYFADNQQVSNFNKKRLPVQSNSLLFPFLNYVLFCFHLTAEEVRLDTLMIDLMDELIDIIYLLAVDIGLKSYVDYYGDQLTKMVRFEDESSKINKSDHRSLLVPTFFNAEVLCVFDYVRKLISLKASQASLVPFPYIPETTPRIRYVILVYRAFKNDYFYEKNYLLPIGSVKNNSNEIINLRAVSNLKDKIVLCISKLGLTKQELETLPPGISIPLWDAIFYTKKNPPAGWSTESYSLISRDDLVALDNFDNIRYNSLNKYTEEFDSDPDGFSNINKEILRLLFPKDQRVFEAYNMLISSKPVRVSIQQRVGMSDHDFMEEQEKHLYNLSIRTMALSVGRGMLTMRTYKPIIAETFPIPLINMTGRIPPRNTVFSMRNNEVPTEMTTWPMFHNGVAAGLRVRLSESNTINSTWIIFNKPKIKNEETAVESQNQHAGFLLALGLNGYISQLSMMNIHDYLCMGNELTRVGVLLGLAAAKRGTMDLFAVKILSIHVEALLPPTSTELDVPPVAEVAAVLGIGLLYQGSGQRHISEVLLHEIGRLPGPEMEHCVDRESYALAAGLALGLVTLGKGNEMTSVAWSSESTSIEDQLCNYMIGGHKRPQTAFQREKYRTPSYQIREGDYVNTDVTSPGATLALGMMFFRTNNKTVANWFVAPDTQHLLDSVRPDFLLLRTLSKGLILWDSIEPTKDWIDSHVPQIVAENALRKPEDNYPRIDYETMSQAYCNIITGACMALGLKFAGSSNESAFRSIMFYTKMFIKLSSQSVVEQAGKSTIESCINVLVLSLSTVMAGTGNIEVMRICRYLRSRTNQTNLVLYGSHLATHMSLGLLFLGGCRYTLSTSPEAIAALICAFFPKFPITSNDNRYHLQAFRHLYVLAAEPRLVIPRDIATGKYVYVHLNLKYKTNHLNRQSQLRAPCFLPELDQIDEITISDNRYWNITFNKDKNWSTLK